MSQSWQNVAQEKQTELLNSIPAEWRLPSDLTLPITTTADKNVTDIPSTCGLLSKADLDITENYTAVGLLDKIRTRQFSSVEATKAFCNCTPARECSTDTTKKAARAKTTVGELLLSAAVQFCTPESARVR